MQTLCRHLLSRLIPYYYIIFIFAITTVDVLATTQGAEAATTTAAAPQITANSHSQQSSSPGYRLSIGLVEIAALATLIGASSAEALALGMRGPGGFPWACMSSFGLVHVIRVSIAASLPEFLTEPLGLRSPNVDAALGVNILLKTTKSQKNPTNRFLESATGRICGLWTECKTVPTPDEKRADTSLQSTKTEIFHGSYAWDADVASHLDSISLSTPTGKMVLHEYVLLVDAHEVYMGWLWQDLAILFASTLKLAEAITLFHYGAGSLSWLSILGWSQAFVSGMIIWLRQYTKEKSRVREETDLVAGELPTALLPGGAGKILLGVTANMRHHWLWTCLWASSATINAVVLVTSFLILGSGTVPGDVIRVWLAFQILWLVGRIIIHIYLKKRRDPGVATPHPWKTAPRRLKQRAVHLMFGLAQSIVMEHPRGWYSYGNDQLDPQAISMLLRNTKPELRYRLPQELVGESCDVVAVIGDPVLRAFLWLNGTFADQDVYDTVFVLIRLEGKIFAIPGARVLSYALICPTPNLPDEEKTDTGLFEPRGSTNDGLNITWVYWLPIEGEGGDLGWLEFAGQNVLGKVKPVFLEEKALDRKLAAGTLKIGLTGVRDVKDIVRTSQEGVSALYDILEDAGLYVK